MVTWAASVERTAIPAVASSLRTSICPTSVSRVSLSVSTSIGVVRRDSAAVKSAAVDAIGSPAVPLNNKLFKNMIEIISYSPSLLTGSTSMGKISRFAAAVVSPAAAIKSAPAAISSAAAAEITAGSEFAVVVSVLPDHEVQNDINLNKLRNLPLLGCVRHSSISIFVSTFRLIFRSGAAAVDPAVSAGGAFEVESS